jgi:20S proteasome subunit alpha 5
MSGIVGDARILIDHARVEAQNHRFNYNEPMSIEQITEAISDLAINFGEGYEGQKRKPMARPYGVALLVAGVDERGPQLYQTDPSGTFLQWQARAIGSGGDTAMTYIKESYHSNMTLAEAEKLILQTLKSVMEEKIAKDNIELSVVRTDTKTLETRSQDYVDTIIKTLA